MNLNDNIAVIAVVSSILISSLLFLLLIWGIKWVIIQLTTDICTSKAIIIDDRAEIGFTSLGDKIYTNRMYLLSFKLEDGETITLSLPYKEYKKHNIGDAGELTFQGTKVIKFIRHTNK